MEISVEISGKSFSSKLRIHNFNLIMQDFSDALQLEEHFNQKKKGQGKLDRAAGHTTAFLWIVAKQCL
jgi:hypothetical protein